MTTNRQNEIAAAAEAAFEVERISNNDFADICKLHNKDVCLVVYKLAFADGALWGINQTQEIYKRRLT